MMISYAQNFEDVLLWRALKNIQDGFYIDVGANDPVIDSVTKWFYDNGWQGINCEPSKEFYQKLCNQRTRDINICKGIADEEGRLHFYNVLGTGLSTTDETVAQKHIKSGFNVQETEIEITTLTKVCKQYVNNKAINFLKIDVEGAEEKVLKGMDFVTFRPWILVIEATLPNSQIINTEWERYVLTAGYKFVFFDGLSCYYIAKEKIDDLGHFFQAPANVFDDFKQYSTICLNEENDKLRLDNINAQKEITLLRKDVATLHKEIEVITHTFSWRITSPLRAIRHIMTKK